MIKDNLIFIRHILDSIEKIELFVKNISKDEFLKDIKLQDAIVRRIEIIGEAVKNLSVNFRNKYANVPWSDIAGMRDKLMHHYFGVDLEIVWKAIQKDLIDLKENIKKILLEETKEEVDKEVFKK